MLFFGSVPCTMSSGLPFHFSLLRYRIALLDSKYVLGFAVFAKTQTHALALSYSLYLLLTRTSTKKKILSDFLLNVRRFRCVALLDFSFSFNLHIGAHMKHTHFLCLYLSLTLPPFGSCVCCLFFCTISLLLLLLLLPHYRTLFECCYFSCSNYLQIIFTRLVSVALVALSLSFNISMLLLKQSNQK